MFPSSHVCFSLSISSLPLFLFLLSFSSYFNHFLPHQNPVSISLFSYRNHVSTSLTLVVTCRIYSSRFPFYKKKKIEGACDQYANDDLRVSRRRRNSNPAVLLPRCTCERTRRGIKRGSGYNGGTRERLKRRNACPLRHEEASPRVRRVRLN